MRVPDPTKMALRLGVRRGVAKVGRQCFVDRCLGNKTVPAF